MRFSFCLAFYAVIALSAASRALAAAPDKSYLILGPGAYRCERVISDLAADAKRGNPSSVILYSTWLAGSLTAYNRDTKATYSILGDESFTDALAWTVQYCQQHPSKIFASAADALVLKLKPHRYASMPVAQPENDKTDDDEVDERADDSEDKGEKESHPPR